MPQFPVTLFGQIINMRKANKAAFFVAGFIIDKNKNIIFIGS